MPLLLLLLLLLLLHILLTFSFSCSPPSSYPRPHPSSLLPLSIWALFYSAFHCNLCFYAFLCVFYIRFRVASNIASNCILPRPLPTAAPLGGTTFFLATLLRSFCQFCWSFHNHCRSHSRRCRAAYFRFVSFRAFAFCFPYAFPRECLFSTRSP